MPTGTNPEEAKPASPSQPTRHVVSREEWLKRRVALLEKEKAFTRERDALSALRRELPWVRVEKEYQFDGTRPGGARERVTLADLFEGRGQLIVYHFMFDPAWSQGCQSCSLLADNYNPSPVHLAQRDTTLVTVSRAPIDKIDAFKKRMNWTFRWVSSHASDFNRDFNVSHTQSEADAGLARYNFVPITKPMSEMPGLSVFYRDSSGIYHTYSTYARGLDILLNTYNLLDMTPKGRDEAPNEGMNWVRHHDRYNDPNFVYPWNEKRQ